MTIVEIGRTGNHRNPTLRSSGEIHPTFASAFKYAADMTRKGVSTTSRASRRLKNDHDPRKYTKHHEPTRKSAVLFSVFVFPSCDLVDRMVSGSKAAFFSSLLTKGWSSSLGAHHARVRSRE
jgi:hypothetical protein